MTLLSSLGFHPQRSTFLQAPHCVSTQEMSLVIPVKNNPAGVSRFLWTLAQTHPPTRYPREVIIVDNASVPPLTLPTALYATGLPLTVLRCTRPGPASARNVGAQQASTEWVLFSDSDCLPSPTFLIGYLDAMNGALGYAGAVRAWGAVLL